MVKLQKILFESKFESGLIDKLKEDGWIVHLYKNSNDLYDTTDIENASVMVLAREKYDSEVENWKFSYEILLPQKKKITFDYIINKIISKHKSNNFYKRMGKYLEKFLINLGFKSGVHVYPSSYGIGVYTLFSNITKINEILDKELNKFGIEYETEYSDARWIYRYKIKNTKQNIKRFESMENINES